MTTKQLSARAYAAYERLDGLPLYDKAAILDAMTVLYRYESALAGVSTLVPPPQPSPIKDEE
jgi:hypothetical protein